MLFAQNIEGTFEATDQDSEKVIGTKQFVIQRLPFKEVTVMPNNDQIPPFFVVDPLNMSKWLTIVVPLQGARGALYHRELRNNGTFRIAIGEVWFKTLANGDVDFDILEGEFKYYEKKSPLYRFNCRRIT